MRLPNLQLTCRLFWQNIASPRSVSTPAAQVWLPATSGFSQSKNRHRKGGNLWIWWSHSTQAQSAVSHCWLTSPMGEWVFTDVQWGLLWVAAKLHQGHTTGSRDIHNGWILSGLVNWGNLCQVFIPGFIKTCFLFQNCGRKTVLVGSLNLSFILRECYCLQSGTLTMYIYRLVQSHLTHFKMNFSPVLGWNWG